MNRQKVWRNGCLAAGLLMGLGLPAQADPYGPYGSPYDRDVYGGQQAEPSCCYSGQRLWTRTNTQSGWSINTRRFDPNGFPLRDGNRRLQPSPLPAQLQGENPWSLGQGGEAYYQRNPRAGGQGGNAQYFQPASYNYPAPVVVNSELDYVPYDFAPLGDPYLAGLAYPYAGPYGVAPVPGVPVLPGMFPGIYPAVPGWGYSPLWPGGGW